MHASRAELRDKQESDRDHDPGEGNRSGKHRRSLKACRLRLAAIRSGRVSFDWVDQGRAEIYSSNPQDRRELVVWAWYPAAPGRDAERAAYLPEPWAPASQFLGLDAAGLRSHAVAVAAVADDQSSYPVLVMSPSGFPPLLLAAVAEDLASHGYVVVPLIPAAVRRLGCRPPTGWARSRCHWMRHA
jgi:predicted dienelactone hydrolase